MWCLSPAIRKHALAGLIQACLIPWASAAADPEIPLPSSPSVGAGVSTHQSHSPDADFQERLLLVDINQQQLNETVLALENQSGTLYLSARDLQRWRLRPPDASTAVEHDAEKYYPLTAIAGLVQAFDPKKMTLMIEARADAFSETARVSRYASMPSPIRSGPGGFVNYDLFAAHAQDASQVSGQFELGYFNRFGVGTTNVLANDLGSSPRMTRLDSTWTVDHPQTLNSLRFGDIINRPGAWGRSVRFGGIQYGTNFATQPGFITFPPQSVAGLAVLPSTVDVFVNNALVSRQTVPPGPFSISNLPVVTGTGEVRLVVRDLFGREQLSTQPFYASQALLRKGLENFSYELGFMRENFGINSFDYGSWISSGTYRRGLSEHVTGEVHAEATQDQATVGGGGDFLIPRVGTLSGYLAGSHSSTSSGGLLLLGIDRLARPWSMGARTQWMSSGFTQVGQSPQQLSPVQLSSFNLSYTAGKAGAIGVAYVNQHNRDQPDVRIATLSYSVSLGRWASFSISAVRILVDDKSTTVFAMLSIPLGASTNLSTSAQLVRGVNADSSSNFTATLQRNLPPGEGYGYRMLSRSDGSTEAEYTLQNNIGTYRVGAAQALGDTATRLEASGGVAWLGGNAFLSRRIDQSFAVVRIPDYPGVRVLADNLPAGRTDARGNAMIPRLRAYDRNLISIDQRDVPLDAEIDALKREVVPYYRSGVDLKFPIKRSRGATMNVQLENGKPLPVGATVRVLGSDAIHAVGYDGVVYVVGLGPSNRLRASWLQQSCEFDVPFVASPDPLPDLGTFICKGVRP
jgi:outer membrane usher protein